MEQGVSRRERIFYLRGKQAWSLHLQPPAKQDSLHFQLLQQPSVSSFFSTYPLGYCWGSVLPQDSALGYCKFTHELPRFGCLRMSALFGIWPVLEAPGWGNS